MVAEWIVALATAGGSELVGARGTADWKAVRARFARLLARGDESRVVGEIERFDAEASSLARVDAALRPRLGMAVEYTWQVRLVALLEDHPDAASDLCTLLLAAHDPVTVRSESMPFAPSP
ncbi:hypothetical protein Lfu02_37410 [Longispora fulva]|uniref:Uncharacterized protein n=1 Tax=Longispora fulva TaxID=619741 RepID=A0A8J7KZQ5_9ACTN|nr:hypothetical protein [Longispora fulva]MBG6141482.1 hypothetical protein [Longispora fulva]GIG59369.1 hypothetical protein Lfu02_37410 [Longispora fulva]